MRVSLVTVTHNELYCKLPRLVYSIQKFLSGYAEYIIIDNASTDGTTEWLYQLQFEIPNLRVVLKEDNKFDLPRYNEIAEEIVSSYILFINPNTRILGPLDVRQLLGAFQDPQVVIAGAPGPNVRAKDATPHGVEGWGWVARLLTERDFWQDVESESTAHVQSWAFLVDREKFLKLGGFRFRNQLFDMRWPEKRFPEKPVDYRDKGVMIAAEIEFSVRARREGYKVCYIQPWPFYHYRSDLRTPEELDRQDRAFGFKPLGYRFGVLGEDKYWRNRDE